MTATQISVGMPVPRGAGAKPAVGPLFGADEAQNLSLLFDPPRLVAAGPVSPTAGRARGNRQDALSAAAAPGLLGRLLPATWFSPSH